ncbi:MAG: hypothetical protein HQL73_09900, partial [Magnetococcales bacterium]|nr:hypothetical protein [Magnetococcales bacterium]
MRNPIYLFLPPRDDGILMFIGGENGLDQVRSGPLETVALAIKGQNVILVVPGRDVLLTWVEPPKGAKRRQLERAVPFMLEDDLLNPVEQLHFALGKVEADGRLPVAVVARKTMDAWMAVVAVLEIQPQLMVCDTLLLPMTPGTWPVFMDPETAWVRLGMNEGFMIERSNLITFLTLALKRPSLPQRIRVRNFSQEPSVVDWSGLPLPVEQETGTKDRMVELVGEGVPTTVVNLLQGG